MLVTALTTYLRMSSGHADDLCHIADVRVMVAMVIHVVLLL